MQIISAQNKEYFTKLSRNQKFVLKLIIMPVEEKTGWLHSRVITLFSFSHP